MKILIVGAGAIGGYFGGRLSHAGRDVTFLVRPRRAAQLRDSGLAIRSSFGDIHISNPKTILAEELSEPFDLILLSCKAYDLETAIDALTPAVGSRTTILPLLNGMRHLDVLEARFGSTAVLGGQCFISAVLDANGAVMHLNDTHRLTFGERDASRTARIDAVNTELSGANFDAALSDNISQSGWEKWAFIAALAGSTCLMRAAIGHILDTPAHELPGAMLLECSEIAKRAGFPMREAVYANARKVLTTPASTLSASMLHDIERGARTEADHILGDLLRRRQDFSSPLLELAYSHVKAYEARQAVG